MAGTLRARASVIGLVALALGAAVSAFSRAHADGSGTQVRLDPAKSSVAARSGSFQVSVFVDGLNHHFVDRGVPSDGLGVFQLALRFNPDVVTVSGFEQGPFMAGSGRSITCHDQLREGDRAVYEFGCISSGPPAAGPQGSGLLGRLTLEPVSTASATTDLTLEGELGGPLGSTDDTVDFKWTGGRVLVAGAGAPPGPTGQPPPRGRSTPSAAAANGAGPGASVTTGGVSGDVQGLSAGAAGSRSGDFPGAGGAAPWNDRSTLLLALSGCLALGGITLVVVGRKQARRSVEK